MKFNVWFVARVFASFLLWCSVLWFIVVNLSVAIESESLRSFTEECNENNARIVEYNQQ
jgi:hypothetical protein